MTNPALKQLGFSPTDRLAVIHADDIGMCQATIPAIEDLFAAGKLTSAAMMVPCPWFPRAAAFARAHPEADLGVHLTLNSEWDHFRWGPLATVDPDSGLIDEDGYFHSDPEQTQAAADLAALRSELDAQIGRAKRAGIDPTHVDTHMFCLGHPRLFRSYLESGLEASTLPLVFRPGGRGWRAFGLPEDGLMVDTIHQLLEQGIPGIDDIYMMNLDTHRDRLEEAKQAISALSPGITHFILHPAVDSPELRAMAPDWRCRVADYETFMGDEVQRFVRDLGVQLIGYQPLRGLMP